MQHWIWNTLFHHFSACGMITIPPFSDDILSTAIKPVTVTVMLGNMNRSVGHAANLLLDM